jgi:hypothetical protein
MAGQDIWLACWYFHLPNYWVVAARVALFEVLYGACLLPRATPGAA